MAMLRVSSYRKLFEEEQWSRAAERCGFQAHFSARGGVSMSVCPEPDLAAARALNKEGVARFFHESSVIAALNDRLAVLIDVVRCLEEENESLVVQIIEMEERMESEQSSTTTDNISGPADYSLEAVIGRLRKEKEEIFCDTEELKGELQRLQKKYDEVVEQRTLIQLEREDVSVEVDAITADCLALREQVSIYEEQLATMERQHETRVENMREPRPLDEGSPIVSLQFPSIDITPAIMDIKEYYSELAESLKFESRASSAATIDAAGKGKQEQLAKMTRGKVMDISKETDVNILKDLITELHKEVAELEKCGDELETEIEAEKAKYLEEIEELENDICQLEEEQADLHLQMKEQSGDNEELLSQKMALDIEIAAYRGLVEEEEERLSCL
ncbi:vimentin-like [Myxocyprinus asiaticus]|uniref:vimentin-like n=1 Tax=Myxocyprinus asiaticus TaxID=70543 RepID=UPI002221EADE|nr:vimentin-like [Myxocyprinus asiaticus]XP_051513836.1 vimentin-like [Myxocyprinus asiaticus]XP_051513837.1 vimentin-like [Myxocyprinus asiaticus]XP_051513838.1 vimentin-like [Myxocyprinus asiaticus]